MYLFILDSILLAKLRLPISHRPTSANWMIRKQPVQVVQGTLRQVNSNINIRLRQTLVPMGSAEKKKKNGAKTIGSLFKFFIYFINMPCGQPSLLSIDQAGERNKRIFAKYSSFKEAAFCIWRHLTCTPVPKCHLSSSLAHSWLELQSHSPFFHETGFLSILDCANLLSSSRLLVLNK